MKYTRDINKMRNYLILLNSRQLSSLQPIDQEGNISTEDALLINRLQRTEPVLVWITA